MKMQRCAMAVAAVLLATGPLPAADQKDKWKDLPDDVAKSLRRIAVVEAQMTVVVEQFYRTYEPAARKRYAKLQSERNRQLALLKRVVDRAVKTPRKKLYAMEGKFEKLSNSLEHARNDRQEAAIGEKMDALSEQLSALRDQIWAVERPLDNLTDPQKDWLRRGPKPDFDPILGRKAPSLRLKDTDGNPLTLKSLRGHQPFLIHFWDRNLSRHLEDLRFLQKVQAKFAGQGVALILVNNETDSGKNDDTPVAAYLAGHGLGGVTCLLDPKRKGQRAFGSRTPRVTYFVDTAGIVRRKYTELQRSGLARQMAAILKEGTAEAKKAGSQAAPQRR